MAAVPRRVPRHADGADGDPRASVAALIGIRLGRLIEAAPRRVAAVATDVRTSLGRAVDPAGDAGRRHGDSAESHVPAGGARASRAIWRRWSAQLLALAGASRPAELAEVAGRPAEVCRPVDQPRVLQRGRARGLGGRDDARMPATASSPTRPATGPEVTAAIARIEQIAGR